MYLYNDNQPKILKHDKINVNDQATRIVIVEWLSCPNRRLCVAERCERLGARLTSMIQEKDQRSRTQDQGSRIKDQGPRIKDEGGR